MQTALSQRLIELVQWTTNNKQFMLMDNVHTLALLGRLVVVAMPALIHTSSNQTKAGLQVLLLFVDGMPHLANRLPQRRLAFYTGLVRGLAQVTGPILLDECLVSSSQSNSSRLVVKADVQTKKNIRRQQRKLLARWQENWISGWLWTLSLVFLNRNWLNESDGEFHPQCWCKFVKTHSNSIWDYSHVGELSMSKAQGLGDHMLFFTLTCNHPSEAGWG